MNDDSIEIIKQNKIGSTKQLKEMKEKSNLLKDIALTIFPIIAMIIIAVIILLRFLFK